MYMVNLSFDVVSRYFCIFQKECLSLPQTHAYFHYYLSVQVEVYDSQNFFVGLKLLQPVITWILVIRYTYSLMQNYIFPNQETLFCIWNSLTMIDAAALSWRLWCIFNKLASLLAWIALPWPHNPVFTACIPTDADGAESTLASAGW